MDMVGWARLVRWYARDAAAREPDYSMGMVFSLPKGSCPQRNGTKNPLSLETTNEGMRLSFGQNTNFTPWSKYSAIWIYDEFILLRLGKSQLGSLFVHIPTRGMTPDVRVRL